MLAQAMAHGQNPASVQYFDIRVRRGHELDDALMQIVHRPMEVRWPVLVWPLSRESFACSCSSQPSLLAVVYMLHRHGSSPVS